MPKMHENELEIDEHLVRSLLQNQYPHLATLPLQPIQSSGTDNALFRLGNEYVVRLPRIEWAPGSNEKTINKEYEWVPKIAQCLKVPISVPLFKGKPDMSYPWPWIITQWNNGHTPFFENGNEYELLAKDLAHFLNELHAIELTNGPYSRRGVPLKEEDEETKRAISQLKDEIDTESITNLWTKLVGIPPWNKNPVWIHGDMLPGNVLIQSHRLSGIIDFTEVGIGDPACDFVIAWSLFNAHSRKIFKENLANIDDNTWERGRGWALSIGLIMLPYYRYSNPVLARLAQRMIEQVTQMDSIVS